jgi:hypothetical protein
MKICNFRSAGFAFLGAVGLSGCTTFSFAPPSVQTEYRIGASRSACGPTSKDGRQIEKNFRGARDLIDNFTTSYRCASHEAADGRQIFEVPSFLALVAAAMGPTFGLTDHGRIAAAGAASVLGRANSYYAPREKMPALDAALDAVLCVKSESIGVAFFDTRQGDAEQARTAVIKAQQQITQLQTALTSLETRRAAAVSELEKLTQATDSSSVARTAALTELKSVEASISDTGAELTTLETALNALVDSKVLKTVSISRIGIAGVDDENLVASVNEQYFEMVSSALMSVERILANRMKSAGKYDPAGLQAEIGKLIADMKAADDKTNNQFALRSQATAQTMQIQTVAEIKLMVAAIEPKLQNCVVRAKLG